MSIKIEELETIAQKALKILKVKDYSDLQLTYVHKTMGTWKVNFRYAYGIVRRSGCFAVDIQSGEFDGIWLDRTW